MVNSLGYVTANNKSQRHVACLVALERLLAKAKTFGLVKMRGGISRRNARYRLPQGFLPAGAAHPVFGTSQLARPTKAGMIAPNTITIPCMVVIWLKKWGSTNCNPDWNSSRRIIIAIEPQ